MGRRLAFAVAVTATVTLLSVAMITALLATFEDLRAVGSSDQRAAMVVQGIVLMVGITVAVWTAVTAAASALALAFTLIGHASRELEDLIRRAGAPMVRRLATVSVASGMLLVPAHGLAPALASPPDSGSDRILVDLGWDATHEQSPPITAPAPTPAPTPVSGPTSPAAEPSASDTQPAQPPPTPTSTTPRVLHTVARGDSLWSIAASYAGADATPREIAALWPRWYEANRSTIGANPDLIHPGMVLHAPTEETP